MTEAGGSMKFVETRHSGPRLPTLDACIEIRRAAAQMRREQREREKLKQASA